MIQSSNNEEHWGYWERVPSMLPDKYVSTSDADKDDRIKRASKKED